MNFFQVLILGNKLIVFLVGKMPNHDYGEIIRKSLTSSSIGRAEGAWR